METVVYGQTSGWERTRSDVWFEELGGENVLSWDAVSDLWYPERTSQRVVRWMMVVVASQGRCSSLKNAKLCSYFPSAPLL